MKKRIISLLLVLAMALSLLPAAFAEEAKQPFTVVVSMEGLTLGQGLYFKPKAYTLDEINDLIKPEYGPYTEETLTAGMATLAFLRDYGIDYTMTGTWESGAYLSSAKDVDTKTLNIPDVIPANGGPSNDDNDGNKDEYLGEFDYSTMSGWMLAENDALISKGCDAWVLAEDGTPLAGTNTYVLRWQFSLWGYGADLGTAGSWYTPYFSGAKKSPLYAAYAASSDSAKKAAALPVMEKLTATQAEVDAALAALTKTAVTGVTLNRDTLTLEPNGTFTLTASAAPADATNKNVRWASDNESVATVENGVVTAKAIGTANITVTTEDGGFTAACAVSVQETPVENLRTVTVKAAPKTVNVQFYEGTNTTKPLAEGRITEDKINGNFHQYTLSIPDGDYCYRGTDSGTNLGGEQFAVSADTTINLLRANVRYSGASLNQEGDYTFTLQNGDEDVVCGTPYLSSNIRYTPTLLIAGTEHTGTVTLAEKWTEDFYLTGTPVGSYKNTPSKTATNAATINLPITQYKIIRLTAPKSAATTFYKQDANYVVEPVTPDSSKDNDDGTITYEFKGTATHSNYQFRSMLDGKVTQAGYLADGNNVTVTFPTDRKPDSQTSTMEYDDGSVLLNVNEKNKLTMKVGDTFKLRAFRAAWEIINTTTGNQMIEPDFHFKVLSGSDVVSIAPTTDCKNTKFPNAKNGNATGNWMNVKAEKEGTAVVAVWYDAIDIYNANPPAASAFSTFGAARKDRYGVFVIKVGNNADLTWNPVSHDGDWDAEFDTVYYTGESGSFTFKPAENVIGVQVQLAYGTGLGTAKTVSQNADGSFTVPVTTGTNIITAVTDSGAVDYQVVRARKISYQITNNTTEETRTNSAPAIRTGDSVTISFDKLDMPVPKMSGIYNPGYLGTAKTAYVLNDTALLTSAGTQYDFSTSPKSSITFTAHFAGENRLKGYISLSSMGDPFGNHRNITDDGKPVNTNAGEVFGDFGSLPDLTFTVTDSGVPASYEDATKITSLTVKGANSTGYLTGFANWTKVEDGNSNWTADSATVKSYAITANVKAKDYNNKLTLRYWYDGEEVHSLPLSSGVTATVSDFTLDAGKLLNLEVEIAPLDAELGEPKVYSYLVYPGKSNLQYIHPVLSALSVTANGADAELMPALRPTKTDYTLKVADAEKITLEGTQLVKIYNTAVTADKSDAVTLTKQKNGAQVGDADTLVKAETPTNPNRKWTLSDLDITDADTLKITVTSYVDSTTSRTYTFALDRTVVTEDEKAAMAVDELIDEIEKIVTLDSKEKIEKARKAYDDLTDDQKKLVTKLDVLTAAEETYQKLTEQPKPDWKTVLTDTLTYIADTVTEPTYGSTNGEWSVLALARGGYYTTGSTYFENYYRRVETYIKSHAFADGKLDANKSTENARLILALSAIGKNPANVSGIDLVSAYGKNGMTWVQKQGLNGTVWALIALDAKNYDPGLSSLRNDCVQEILDAQLSGGGWALSGSTADIDLTAMALQALVNYQGTTGVSAAVEKGFTCLSGLQNASGDFGSAEADAQVIVALSAWDFDAAADERFRKNGSSVLDALLRYYVTDTHGFEHEAGKGVNAMATDQAAYALVAYDRFKNSKNRLYDMSDVQTEPEQKNYEALLRQLNGTVVNNAKYSTYLSVRDAKNAYQTYCAGDEYPTLTPQQKQELDSAYNRLQPAFDSYLNTAKGTYQQLLNTEYQKIDQSKLNQTTVQELNRIYNQALSDLRAGQYEEQLSQIESTAAEQMQKVGQTIRVSFRLIGCEQAEKDVNLSSDSYLPDYITWIPTTTVEVKTGATVYDVFTKALQSAGLSQSGAESGYVSAIYAPSVLGGYRLGEFDNGLRSGWMYTLNGSHPGLGLKEQTVQNGDVLIWHYVNDYANEVADWIGGSSGTGACYNGWLRAADISPETYVKNNLGKIVTVTGKGKVTPELRYTDLGRSVTFTFTPDAGQQVQDVKVDGVSVGKVTTYTCQKLTFATRIAVTFSGAAAFADVKPTDWFYEDVNFVVGKGLFTGTSATLFSPNTTMTRAMLVTVLYRLAGQPAVTGTSRFRDVGRGSWYEAAVLWASGSGIVNGTGETTFTPNAPVTREQMAAILYRYAAAKGYDVSASTELGAYADSGRISAYALSAMRWANAAGLISGSGNVLTPTAGATRAQVAAILHRFCERYK